ncbi:MAG: energy transducer TonB, partial [Gammaproteobacteria bacterium]
MTISTREVARLAAADFGRFRFRPYSTTSGWVIVEFCVDRNGGVTHPKVEKSSNPQFNAAALQAI